jgi:hypothetical protein
MKIFDDLAKKLAIGQKAENFSFGEGLSLSNLKGSPIFLVFWKTL